MKKLMYSLLAGLFVFNLSLSAQNGDKARMGGGDRQFSPEQHAERLAKELNLTDAQKKQVAEFYTKQQDVRKKEREEFQKKKADVREENKAEREKFRAEREKIQKEHDVELEKIIGKDKMEQLKKNREERMQKNRENRPNRQGNN